MAEKNAAFALHLLPKAATGGATGLDLHDSVDRSEVEANGADEFWGRRQMSVPVRWVYGVDSDTGWAVSERGGFGIDPHRAFRGVILRMAAGAVNKSHDRAHVDDRPAASLCHL
jgi:hypothetical protein